MNFFKKAKQEELSTSSIDPMNPEVFPDEIREQIFSFLTVNEMLEASLVSKLWHDNIGASLTFRKRIAVKLHSWSEEPTAIENSSRSYEILSIADFKISSKALQCLKGKKWKTVTCNVGKISSQSSFMKLASAFECVKDLKLLCINIRKLDTSKRLVLPELKNLVFSDCTLDLFDVFIAPQPSLKSLSLRHVSCDILSPRRTGEAVVEFLQLNKQLKDLEMNHLVANDLFLVNIAPMLSLQLRSLTIGLNETPKDQRPHIEEFLKSQGESLEQLKLILHQKSIKKGPNEWGYWGNDNNNENGLASDDALMTYNCWNSMVSLKSLCIRFLKDSAELEDRRELMKTLKPNTNVTSLFVQFMSVTAPASIILDIMKLSPNLKTIYVTRLTPAVVRYAAVNLMALRELKCFSFEGECHQELNELIGTRSHVNKFIVISDRCALG